MELTKPIAFKDYYEQLTSTPSGHAENIEQGPKITLSATGIALPALLRQIADEFGASIIAHHSLDKSVVNLEVKGATISEVLAAVARRLDQRLTKIGQTWYLGPVLPEDRGCLVRKVGRLNDEQLAKILESFKSEIGRFSAFPDGVVVMADRVEVLERLANALDELERLPSGSWVCQLYLVQLNNSAKASLGLKTDYTVKFTANIASSAPETKTASLALSSLLESSYSVAGSSVLASPLLVVRNGSPGIIKYGNEVRLPKKTTSPYGTVEVTGYEVIQTGFNVSATIRDDSAVSGLLDLDLSLSSISAFVDGVPQIQREQFTTTASILSGGTYLLGSLDLGTKGRGLEGNIMGAKWSQSSEQNTLYVWARMYKIKGKTLYSTAKEIFEVPSPPKNAQGAHP
jgi:hypothetical protein